ncbi:FCD domain-containing protein [Rhodobacterales bacterium HKCCE3408]|nr:FCD domain-containing protein [Rhodobacterales bacterium HKCCE3408]
MPAPEIAPIDQTKLRESVYGALRDAFVRGKFAPGDSVSLRQLADMLGTSMTPVREAVRRLVAEGALMDTPSRTLKVPTFDARRMSDLKAARLALETLVLDQAMDRMTAADIDMLDEMIASADRQQQDGVDLDLNYRFHFRIYALSASEVLMPLIEALWLQYGAYLNVIVSQKQAREIDEHKLHHEMIAAFRAGDRASARRALETDIERSFRIIAERVDAGWPKASD